MKKEVIFSPNRWMVDVSFGFVPITVTSPETGEVLYVSRHSCRDRHHAASLLYAFGITSYRKSANWRQTCRSSCRVSARKGTNYRKRP